MSISAQSAASTPPASERMVTSASRESYSPESRVRTSSSSMHRADAGQLALGLGDGGLVALVLGHLVHQRDVVEPAAQLLDPAQVALQVGQLGGDRLRRLDVVPEVGRGGLLLEVGDLAAHVVDRAGRPRSTSGSCSVRPGRRRSQRPRLVRVVRSAPRSAPGVDLPGSSAAGATLDRARRVADPRRCSSSAGIGRAMWKPCAKVQPSSRGHGQLRRRSRRPRRGCACRRRRPGRRRRRPRRRAWPARSSSPRPGCGRS